MEKVSIRNRFQIRNIGYTYALWTEDVLKVEIIRVYDFHKGLCLYICYIYLKYIYFTVL